MARVALDQEAETVILDIALDRENHPVATRIPALAPPNMEELGQRYGSTCCVSKRGPDHGADNVGPGAESRGGRDCSTSNVRTEQEAHG